MMNYKIDWYLYYLNKEIGVNEGLGFVAIFVLILSPWIVLQLMRDNISSLRRRIVYYFPLLCLWLSFISEIFAFKADEILLALVEVYPVTIVHILFVAAIMPFVIWFLYHALLVLLAVFLSPFLHKVPPQTNPSFTDKYPRFANFEEIITMPKLTEVTRTISRSAAQLEIAKQKKLLDQVDKRMIQLRDAKAEISNLQCKLAKLEAIKFQREEAKMLRRSAILIAEYETNKERERLEAEQKAEHDRREALKEKERPIRTRKFKDVRVTRLYALYQDCFPKGDGWTCHGHFVEGDFSKRARLVLQPCFKGQPKFEALKIKILKLIHVDAGDSRLSAGDRTRIMQIFYEIAFKTKTTNPMEDTICL